MTDDRIAMKSGPVVIPTDWRDCPVCKLAVVIIDRDPNGANFDQACIEMDLHPNHRPGAIEGVRRSIANGSFQEVCS